MSGAVAPVGLTLASSTAPEELPAFARLAEELGFAELWFAEDCFFSGGIALAASALAVTEQIPVGLGILSAMTRHPALTAMEIATLARIHPGRLRPGIGLGVPAWLEQMDLRPKSMLTALRECVGSIRQLLAGDEVTLDGRSFRFDRIALTHTPAEPVPLFMGVVGPKATRLSGEIADGNVLSVLTGVEYLRRTRELIADGAADAGRRPERHIATCAIFCVDADGARAKREVRRTVAFYLSEGGPDALTDAYGISDTVREMAARGGTEAVEREMPEQWIEDLAVAGEPDECAEKINRLLAAGAGSVALAPTRPGDAQLRLAAAEVLPRVHASRPRPED